jgi:hypothetical protein
MSDRNGFRYYDSIPVPQLSESVKQEKVPFCLAQLWREHARPIVFTDESSVQQDMQPGGISRRRGNSFPKRCAKRISIQLASSSRVPSAQKCGYRINAESYLQMLADGRIFDNLIHALGLDGFVWQQDNAPLHRPAFEVIHQ